MEPLGYILTYSKETTIGSSGFLAHGTLISMSAVPHIPERKLNITHTAMPCLAKYADVPLHRHAA